MCVKVTSLLSQHRCCGVDVTNPSLLEKEVGRTDYACYAPKKSNYATYLNVEKKKVIMLLEALFKFK